jgi:putative Ca2+/H+ antiporter (TMEM165/GDT1 family)
MDLKLYLLAAGITFVAELPDKTAFTSFILSTQEDPWAVFVGGACAMVLHSAIAVGAGSLLALLPAQAVRWASGWVFLLFAALMWLRKPSPEEEEEELVGALRQAKRFGPMALRAFGLIFLAEWGDLTQFSTAALAAKYQSPWTLFAAAVTGLWAAIALAGWLGSKLGAALSQRNLQRLAAGVFAAVGLWTLLR